MADFTLAPKLRKCSNEDLEYLVSFIKEKANFTETLTVSPGYRAHYPNHSMYVDEIAHHIRLFGGNTIANKYRGCPPTDSNHSCPYRCHYFFRVKDHPMKRLARCGELSGSELRAL